MNKQDQGEANNRPTIIEDLTITSDQAAAVKGGDHKQWINVASCNMGGHR